VEANNGLKEITHYSVHLFGRTFTECLQAPINYKEEGTQELKAHFSQDKRVVA
jgi:hypothetical protein